MTRRIRVVVINKTRTRIPVALGAWLEQHAPARARGEVSIAIVSDAAMRRLNRQFRGKDYATDVLSFSENDAPPLSGSACRNLGEVVIASGVAWRQARSYGHSLSVELKILALHGLLHLLGYDHETDTGEMRRREDRLRRRAGLPVGLIARASRRSSTR